MAFDSRPDTIELSAGPIDYVDTGGDGPTVVLLDGVLMSHTVWRDVNAELTPDGLLVEIADSYTVVIALDQPQQLADAVRSFTTSTADQSR
jgi:pimeloyl-ACP methyl ester carboxylesterase